MFSFVQVCHYWCPPFSMCLPGLSLVALLVSALFHWPCISIHLSARSSCSISIHLSPRSVTAGVRPVPLAMQNFYLFPRSVTGGDPLFPLATQHFYSFVSQFCHWRWRCSICVCLSGLLLLVSALFRWPAMQHVYSFVSQVCHCWCPPFSAFYSFASQACRCRCPPFSAGHVAFLFICHCFHLSPRGGQGLSLLVSALLLSALFRWPCSIVTVGVRPFLLAMRKEFTVRASQFSLR